ncbi:unnamed protein product, partial [Rotaria sp. Silwood1]
MSQIEKLLSLKGKPMIHHEGYIYTVECTTSTKLIFRCQNRDCKAQYHTNSPVGVFLSQPTAHCHAPQPDRVPVIQLKNEITARAVTTDESIRSIIHSALRTYPLSAAGELPKNEALMLMFRRQRTVETVDADGCLPEKLKKTYRDEDFILCEDKNLIIITTQTNLSILKQNKHWFADGTFKVCPDDHYQLFTLHTMMTNAIIPLVYGLLIGKSAEDYNLFFKKVLVQDDFQSESIMTDFETGTMKSVREMLPNVSHKAIWQQVQEKGLVTKYREDEYFRLNVKKLIALAFVPVDEVTTDFDLIANQFDDGADDLLDYFEKTWIGEPKRRGTCRKKPQYDHNLWNIHDRVIAAIPRPNNSVEGWHNAFASRVTMNHTDIVKLAAKIRLEQSKFE